MDNINNSFIEDSSPLNSREPIKAVIFGSQPRQLKQMQDQLARKKVAVRSVLVEKNLLSQLSDFDPDLIFLEINGVTRSPIDEIVKVVFMWTKNYARKINKTLNSPTSRLWDKARVILFKTDPDDQEIHPKGDVLLDLDDILFKCQEIGDIQYMGLYSSWSFYSKIEPFLSRE